MRPHFHHRLWACPHPDAVAAPIVAALLSALPERAKGRKLPSIPGVVPGQFDRPAGCLFSPRCAFVFDACHRVTPRRASPVPSP